MTPDTPRDSPAVARLAVWLVPSVTGACVGGLVAGAVEAGGASGPGAAIATAGFAAALVVPLLLAGAVVGRLLWVAWRPARLASALVDERGGAPRLLAWLLFLGLSAFALSWATFNGVRLLAWLTRFKPTLVALAMPIIVVTTAAICAALSRPLVDALTAGIAALDRRAHRRFGRSLTAPWLLVAYALVLGTTAAVLTWRLSLRPRLGHIDLGVAFAPGLAALVAIAVHAVWHRTPPRTARTIAAGNLALAAAVIGAALWLRTTDPALLLGIWSRPIAAGVAIDALYDLDHIHDEIPASAFRPVALPGAAHPDIVVVTVDTVRADRTPIFGGPARMPHLAALAQRGTSFRWAFAPGNVTRRSVPSMVLGLAPPRVRGRVAGWALRLDPRHVLLAERMRAGGYDTAAFVCCGAFWDPVHRLGTHRGWDKLTMERDGGVLTKAARAWIEARDRTAPTRPLFLYVHLLEPHNWAMDRMPPSDAERRRTYDATLAQIDGFLGDLQAGFDGRGAGRQPIVIVTSDHGEGLGDHDAVHHSAGLYNSQIRVPWVVAGPGISPQRVDEVVSLTDLAPTILELAGFAPPGMPAMDGASQAPLLTGKRPANPEGGYAFAAQIQDRSVERSERAVVKGRWKLIENRGGVELYDLRSDPDEKRNLAGQNAAQVAAMKRLLQERAAIDRTSPFP